MAPPRISEMAAGSNFAVAGSLTNQTISAMLTTTAIPMNKGSCQPLAVLSMLKAAPLLWACTKLKKGRMVC